MLTHTDSVAMQIKGGQRYRVMCSITLALGFRSIMDKFGSVKKSE